MSINIGRYVQMNININNCIRMKMNININSKKSIREHGYFDNNMYAKKTRWL